jgi:hypothetical protein
VDWQGPLDDYLAWTREMEWREAALAHAQARRAEALARMRAAGIRPTRIAYIVGLTRARVGQMLAAARKAARAA